MFSINPVIGGRSRSESLFSFLSSWQSFFLPSVRDPAILGVRKEGPYSDFCTGLQFDRINMLQVLCLKNKVKKNLPKKENF